MQTPRQQLATLILGRPVMDYIRAYRKEGASWRAITRNLYEDTDGRVDVTAETLRSWLSAQ